MGLSHIVIFFCLGVKMSNITGNKLAFRIYTLINSMNQPDGKAKDEALDKLGEAFSFVDDKNIPDTVANNRNDEEFKKELLSLKNELSDLKNSISNIKTSSGNISEEIDKKINYLKVNIDNELKNLNSIVRTPNQNKSNNVDTFDLIEQSVNAKLTEFTKYVQSEFEKINNDISANKEAHPVFEDTVPVFKMFKGTDILENGLEITYSNAKLPVKKHEATGYDAFACFPDGFEVEKTIYPGKTEKISLGVICNIPSGYEIQCRPRSGLSSKGISVSFGSVDEDYRGVIKAVVTNLSKEPYTVKQGDRICQLVISKKTDSRIEWANETDKIDDTSRGSNGFGSTGV